MSMVSRFLIPGLISVNFKAADKADAVLKLCTMIAAKLDCDAESLFDTIMNRESLKSTAVGHGVAIPHARCDVSDFVVAAGVCEKGIDFGSADAIDVRIIFLILSPKNETTSYLQILSQIAALLNVEKNREALLGVKTPEEFIELVKKNERR